MVDPIYFTTPDDFTKRSLGETERQMLQLG